MIIHRVKRTSQSKQLVKIDWSNPITRGLTAVFVGNQTVNLLNNVPISSPNDRKIAVTPGGLSQRFDSANDRVVVTATNTSSEQLSIVFGGRKYAGTGAGSRWCSADVNGSGEKFLAFSNTNELVLSRAYSTAAQQDSFNNAFPYNEYAQISASYDGTVWSAYRNGNALARTNLVTKSGSPVTGSSKLLYIGNNIFVTRYLNGDVAYLFAFDRALAVSEGMALSVNPWQVLAPQPRKLWVVPASGTTHTLTGSDAAQSSTSSASEITQDHSLTGTGSSQSNTLSTGAVSQSHALTGDSASQSNLSDSGSISQNPTLTGNNGVQTVTSSSDAVNQTHELTGAGSICATISSTGEVSQTHSLIGADATQSDTSSTGSLLQPHALTGSGSSCATISSTGAVGQTHLLTGVGAEQLNASAVGSIVQTHAPAGADCSQANLCSTGEVDLSFNVILAGTNCTQTQGSTSGEVSQTHLLPGQAATQVNVSSAGYVTQSHSLAGSNCAQTNECTAGGIDLTWTAILSGADCGQITDSSISDIRQTHKVAGAGCAQVNTAANGAITQTHLLAGFNCSQVNASGAGVILLPSGLTAGMRVGTSFEFPVLSLSVDQENGIVTEVETYESYAVAPYVVEFTNAVW